MLSWIVARLKAGQPPSCPAGMCRQVWVGTFGICRSHARALIPMQTNILGTSRCTDRFIRHMCSHCDGHPHNHPRILLVPCQGPKLSLPMGMCGYRSVLSVDSAMASLHSPKKIMLLLYVNRNRVQNGCDVFSKMLSKWLYRLVLFFITSLLYVCVSTFLSQIIWRIMKSINTPMDSINFNESNWIIKFYQRFFKVAF